MSFIKLDRKLMENWLWDDRPFTRGQAWIDLLFLANYADRKKLIRGSLVECKRGEVNTSIHDLSNRWGWDRKKIRAFLKTLETEKMVTTHSTPSGTTITIENYEVYNDVGTTPSPTTPPLVTPELPHNSPTSGQPTSCKKGKKGKNNNIYIGVPAELEPAFMEFVAMRDRIKKPLTSEESVNRQIAKLCKLGATTEEQIAILHQSVDNCWQGVFPLKGETVQQQKKPYRTDEDIRY